MATFTDMTKWAFHLVMADPRKSLDLAIFVQKQFPSVSDELADDIAEEAIDGASECEMYNQDPRNFND